jgi:hypothetical protein
VITKPLLATDREQPKPVPAGQGMNSAKKQQFDRKSQAFAGYFRVNTGRVQFLQMPAFSLILYSQCLSLYCKCLTLANATNSFFGSTEPSM